MHCVVTTEPVSVASSSRKAGDDGATPPLPTLGEILDRIAAERPDWRMSCDPALRDSRIGQVRIVGR